MLQVMPMPWTAVSGNAYKICLLDTNAISEIVKRPAVEGRGFIERFPPGTYAPCFTAYTLVELRRNADVYDRFLQFFGVYPCFVTAPHELILQAELAASGPLPVESILLYPFSPMRLDKSVDLRSFLERLFGSSEMIRAEQEWRSNEQSTLDAWLVNAKNFRTQRSVPNRVDADRYVKIAAIDTLCFLVPDWMKSHVDRRTVPDIGKLPSLHIMLYSQYYRVFDRQRPMSRQDVTDLRIMACSPYVDAIVTETYHAEILKKVRNRVRGLKSVEIKTLRDIRPTSPKLGFDNGTTKKEAT
jgi:hypothetical protein